jgi:hypothetical protein
MSYELSMELVPLKTVHGEEKAWEALLSLNPKAVCSGAGAAYDPGAETYIVKSFGIDFEVSLRERTITSGDPRAGLFLGKLRDFFRLSVLWYLTGAKDIPFTNRLVRPVDVKGGHRFSAGTHVLPLDRIQEWYGKDKAGFVRKGEALGAEPANLGDVALRLYPLPRVPVTVILWLEDKEFPARACLLFDSTVDYQIPLSDIVWSVAMMSALAMLEE